MSTINTLLSELESRLNDVTNVVWSEAELKSFLRYGIKQLYPTYFTLQVSTTTAGAGPLQTMPATAKDLYMVGHKRATSTRVRPVRGWVEGTGSSYISKSGITGDLLVWAWTAPFTNPTLDSDTLDIPAHCEEVVLLIGQKRALEKVLTDRVTQERYLSLNVRQADTEQEVLDTIDSISASIKELMDKAIARPEIRN